MKEIIKELEAKNKELEKRIRLARRKLASAINHYEDERKNWALRNAIEILDGERKD